jgi:hypothetical protein
MRKLLSVAALVLVALSWVMCEDTGDLGFGMGDDDAIDDDDAVDDDDAIDDDDAVDDDDVVDDDDAVEPSLVVFSAIGDVPYDEDEHDLLRAYIAEHNALDPSEFVIHLGDFKPYNTPCSPEVFGAVATTLRTFEVPVFVVPGDNEYNDCADPVAALTLWRETFAQMHAEWDSGPDATHQPDRLENFAWMVDRVLFVGVNVVGGSVHDEDEWTLRLTEDAEWLEQQFQAHGDDIAAAVVFSHATLGESHDIFLSRFRAASAALGLPVLYLQGDAHGWNQERPWQEQNILRVSVDADGADPVIITVHDEGDTFRFNRTPFE